MDRSERRQAKLRLEDIRVESFDVMSPSAGDGGTVHGYETQETHCLTGCQSCAATECCTTTAGEATDYCQSGCATCSWCSSWDTCPQLCASGQQAC
jgi:hypothetical protein